MGRVSKRGKINEVTKVVLQKKRYRAGIYARLSTDFDLRKNESIEVQIEIAKKFVEEFNDNSKEEFIEIVDCYTDLGKTGSNFEREGFLRLMQDIRMGEINCVIVKDLSRFGRNYLEAGNYIEKIFPFLGVRFIAVSDGYDSESKENTNKEMISEIKNLVNDMYAKDFSLKHKILLKQRREEGSYVGGVEPYGYKIGYEGKRRTLIPNEDTALIVKFIFEKFVEEKNYQAVTDELNRRKINPPTIYRKNKEVYYIPAEEPYKGWDKASVCRILKNETYIGNLIQGKTTITARNEKNRVKKPEEEWCVKIGMHEPIVEKQIYEKAKNIREQIIRETLSKKNHTSGYPIEENIFDSVLFCGVCGKKMTRSSYVKQYADGTKARMDGYFCTNGKRTKVTSCPDSNRISKAELVDILLPLIRTEYAVFLKKPKYYEEYARQIATDEVQKVRTVIKTIEHKIERCQEEEGNIYMKYRLGNITQKEYVSFKMNNTNEMESLEKQKKEKEKEVILLEKLSVKYVAAIKSLLKLKSGKELTKEMVEAFVSKIYLYSGKRIEVVFSFTLDCAEENRS